jgi:hypothetical protein
MCIVRTQRACGCVLTRIENAMRAERADHHVARAFRRSAHMHTQTYARKECVSNIQCFERVARAIMLCQLCSQSQTMQKRESARTAAVHIVMRGLLNKSQRKSQELRMRSAFRSYTRSELVSELCCLLCVARREFVVDLTHCDTPLTLQHCESVLRCNDERACARRLVDDAFCEPSLALHLQSSGTCGVVVGVVRAVRGSCDECALLGVSV